jgi:hypothetical protein
MDLAVLHSHMRHLVLFFGALAFIIPLIAHLRKTEIPAWGKLTIRLFVIVISLQFLLGIVQLIQLWNQPDGALRYRLEHAVIMVTAVGIAHYASKYLRMPRPVGPRNTMIMMGGVVVLTVLGILMLPQGRKLFGLE